MKGDLDAAAALIDFPVLMVTDDAKGEGSGEPWTREQWLQVMKPFYAKPMPPGSMAQGKRTIVLLTDSLALVGSGWTMTTGSKKVSGTSGLVLVRKGGQWKAKAMAEGGWGDTPMAAAAPGEAAPGTAKQPGPGQRRAGSSPPEAVRRRPPRESLRRAAGGHPPQRVSPRPEWGHSHRGMATP